MHGAVIIVFQVTGDDLTRRTDDTAQTLRKRLDTYCQHTVPILDYYQKLGLLVKIDASKPREEVWAQVKAAVEKCK